MAGVEAEQRLARERVAEVELVRTDDIRLGADAEELALDRIAVQRRVDRLGEDRVERLGQPLPGSLAIDGRVLRSVGDPDVGHAGRAERRTDRLADPPAGDAMLDPEPPDR